jgi:hypothetical protein
MSSVSKSGGGRRRNDKPIQPINLSNVILKKNDPFDSLPAPPPAPNINIPSIPSIPSLYRNDKGITPTNKVKSPHDGTQLMINGQVVKMDKIVDNRITNKEEKIRPMTPPQNHHNLIQTSNILENNISPNRYIDSNINIVDTPPKNQLDEHDIEDSKSDSPMSEASVNIEHNNQTVKSETPIEFKPKEIDNQSVRTSKTVNKNLKSLFPSFKPSEKPKAIFNPLEKNEGEDEDDDIPIDTTSKSAISPVNIPYPVFESNIRTTSPIQTIGPKSPGVISKPLFTETGKSSTPRIAARAMTPPKPMSVRAMTPPPAFRSPRRQPEYSTTDNDNETENRNMRFYATPNVPVYTQNNDNGKSENYYDPYGVNNRITHRPNYSKITREQETYLRSEFKVKFGILRSTYPQWDVIEPSDSLTLEQVHDLYDHYLKQILISRETGNYKTYMVIFLMVIEVIGVKFLKLNMSGYTLSQLRIINRYDSLFSELGEKYLVSSGSNWPVEVRIVMMMLFNAVIFLVVRYLCSWMGMEGIADTLQGMIDSMLNGPSMMSHNTGGPMGSSNPIPDPVSSNPEPNNQSTGSNTIDKIADMFGNFMGKNNSNITEKIAEIGTMFTNKTQNNNNAAKQKENKDTKDKDREKRRKINKKKLFED